MKKTIIKGTISFLSKPEKSGGKMNEWSYDKIGFIDSEGKEVFIEYVYALENMMKCLSIGSEGVFLFAKQVLQPTVLVAYKGKDSSELFYDPESYILRNWAVTWLLVCPAFIFICQIVIQKGNLEMISDISKVVGGVFLLTVLMGGPLWSRALDAFFLRRVGTKFLKP